MLSKKKSASDGNADRNYCKLYCSIEIYKEKKVVLILKFEGLWLQNRHEKTGCRNRGEEGRNSIVHCMPKSHGISLRVRHG